MEETSRSHSYVCVKVEHVGVIREKLKEIREKFRVSLHEVPAPQAKPDCGTDADSAGLSVLFFTVEKSGDASQIEVSQTANRVQCFVDSLCSGLGDHGDDSSYDSDAEAEGEAEAEGDDVRHQDVSRTTSETLAAEYADYITQQGDAAVSRLEFGIRLGYTEPLVRAALRRLGPNPAQNELLAELIRQAQSAQPNAQQPAQHAPSAQHPQHAQHPRRQAGVGAAAAGACAATAADDDAALQPRPRLRPIVIDGSNVAMGHGNKEVFSCRGLRLCVDWFRARGHTDITVFVPKWRKEAPRPDNLITEQAILGELERERLLVYTPSRLVGGKRVVCYDDRYVLRLAADTGGVVVSNDNYRDLAQENAEFRRVVEQRILMFSFVNDRFMPPEDPLGRSGPSLDQFLRLPAARTDAPPPCPYAKKCTYGNKCKFSHPERGLLPHKSVTERLAEQAQKHLVAAGLARTGPGKLLKGKSLSLPLDSDVQPVVRKNPLTRSHSTVPGTGMTGMMPTAASALGAPPSDAAVNAANLHRPLQRQLSLNPTYDARLAQMRKAMGMPPMQLQPPLQPQMQPPSAAAPVEALPVHAGVSRIASAPESYRTWAQQQRRLGGAGGSDPQLQMQLQQSPAWNQALYHHQAQQARHRMHYHLASIFPEELVATAMSLYPDEVDAQKICAAILSLQTEPKR
ncbi:probable ribonuclease ZC3H12D [Thrips palmi]|uniref:Probable ribonuclease ZC3H12D n=1 Tax=Thrips palmi TaxID=161013 RepID=A0A6P8YYJ0_THRPL|nr:probable ribonuclease ZC3H12D [Thrips palmi]